jgi:hypothetical protein
MTEEGARAFGLRNSRKEKNSQVNENVARLGVRLSGIRDYGYN